MITERELVALMSPQMKNGYWAAKSEALREISAVNVRHHNEYEMAQREWNAENGEKWETIRNEYHAIKDSIREQIAILQQKERDAYDDYQKKQDAVYREQYEAIKHISEAQKPASDANQATRKVIESQLLAKYEDKLRKVGKIA
jgi:hypothetical protein